LQLFWCLIKNYYFRPEETEQLRDHFDKYVPACIDFVLEGLIMNELTKPLLQTIPVTNLNMARQLCTMLEVILSEETKIRQAPVRFS